MLLDEVAVEQAHNRGLGNPLGELEVIFSQGLSLRKPRFAQLPLESPLLTGGSFKPKQDRQNLQEEAPIASRFIQHSAVGFGDLGEF
jgi:hypothetical protein